MFKLAEDFGAAGTPYRDAFNNLWLKIAPIRGMSIIFR